MVLDDLSAGVREAVPAGVAFHQGDAGDRDLLGRLFSEFAITAVMHFAGSIIVPESIANPAKYYRNNTAKSRALAEAALRSVKEGRAIKVSEVTGPLADKSVFHGR